LEKKNGDLVGIEVKASSSISQRDLKKAEKPSRIGQTKI
jgi:hypothetical protein